LANDPTEACQVLRDAITQHLSADNEQTGLYLQKAAKYLFAVDRGEALQMQRAAYDKTRFVFVPPEVVRRPPSAATVDVQARVLNWLHQFSNPNGALAQIQALRARLSCDSTPEVLEDAVMELGCVLGAESIRPEHEYGVGPDNLWLWPGISILIEVKNQNEESVHKKDAAQLLQSIQWFSENYPTRSTCLPLIVAKIAVADKNASFPAGTKILLPDKLSDLISRIESFYNTLIRNPKASSSANKFHDLQSGMGLLPEQFMGTFAAKLFVQR
jgi:hypothetical protein